MGGGTYFYFVMTGLIASFFNIFAYLQVELVGAYVSLIVSQLKAPVTIVVSYFLFGNPCTASQVVGLLMVVAGLTVFKLYGKITQSGESNIIKNLMRLNSGSAGESSRGSGKSIGMSEELK